MIDYRSITNGIIEYACEIDKDYTDEDYYVGSHIPDITVVPHVSITREGLYAVSIIISNMWSHYEELVQLILSDTKTLDKAYEYVDTLIVDIPIAINLVHKKI